MIRTIISCSVRTRTWFLAWCFRCHALKHQEQSSHLGELDIASGWFWDQADKLALLNYRRVFLYVYSEQLPKQYIN